MPRDETFEKPLPSSPDTERAILGALILDNSLADEAFSSLALEDFYTPSHRECFAVMIELQKEQMPLDPIVIADRLRANGQQSPVVFVSTLSAGLPHTTTVKPYVKILKEKTAARWGIKEAERIQSALYDNEESQIVFSQVTDRFSAMREKSATNGHGGQLIDLAREVTDHLYTIRAGINTAVPTGLADLDRLAAGGIRPGELWGIAARSSRGKSSILVQMLLNMAKRGQPVVLFSLETQALSVALRILASETGVSLNSLRAPGGMRESEIDELIRTVEQRFQIPFWIYTKGFKPVQEIKRKIHSLNKSLAPEKRLAAVGIDWYGKLRSKERHENRTQELKFIADFLQEMAIEEDVALCVPAQFNRSGWNSNEPGPANIDGGEAYHDACDLFAVLHTDATMVASTGGQRLSKAKLTVFKQRNGPIAVGKDALKMMFDRTRLQFFPRIEDAGEEAPREPVTPVGDKPISERERADFL